MKNCHALFFQFDDKRYEEYVGEYELSTVYAKLRN